MSVRASVPAAGTTGTSQRWDAPAVAPVDVDERAATRRVLSRTTFPVLLLAVVTVSSATLHFRWDFGQVTFLFLLATLGSLMVLERLIPYERAWHPTRRELRKYGAFFVLTVAAGGLSQLPVAAVVAAIAHDDPALALWQEVPLALLLQSFVGYVVHRTMHTNPWLWRLHGVHHAPKKVNVANNSVNNLLDVLLAQVATQIPLAVIGFSKEAVFVVGVFIVAQGLFAHANVDVRIGVLNHVFGSAEQHRLHHSTDLAEAGHFGAELSIWDRAFGTFTWRPGRAPAAVGLADPGSFPATDAVVASQLTLLRRPDRAVGVTGSQLPATPPLP